MTESMNHTEVTCVADFLNILKNDVEELSSDKERFFRGLSKTDYIETDFPSIYRSPDNNSDYEPYIKYEHKMFYDLVSRFPEQFSSCKNTFEHLVMMQHYGFPTRLLDVTSNPLVALYFACVDRHGNVNEEDDKRNELNGSITIYDIPNEQIKNYNSDTVTVLSNLARMNEKFIPNIILYNNFLNVINEGLKSYLKYDNCEIVKKTFNIFNIIMNEGKASFDKNNISEKAYKIICDLKKIIEDYNNQSEKYLKLDKEYDSFVFEELDEEFNFINYIYQGPQGLEKNLSITSNKLSRNFNDFIDLAKELKHHYYSKHNIQFKQSILEEKNHFIYEIINRRDMTNVFCVKPKLNNPRVLNQNGAFLLSGFASNQDTKLPPPTQHFELKAKSKINQCKINILIKGYKKLGIVNELKQLGIHRAFLFPEIDKVAQIVTNEYMFPKI